MNIKAFNSNYKVMAESVITHKVAVWLMPNKVNKIPNIKPVLLVMLRDDRSTPSIIHD